MLKLLLLAALCSSSSADYLLLRVFSSTDCQGNTSQVVASSLEEACSQTLTLSVCLNSTASTLLRFSDASCSTVVSRVVVPVKYPSCVQEEYDILGRSLLSSCVAGSFQRPSSGLVQDNLFDASSCAQQPVSVVQYATQQCLTGTSQSTRITCEEAGAVFRSYSSPNCSGSARSTQQVDLGCRLDKVDNHSSVTSCFSSFSVSATPSAAATPSATVSPSPAVAAPSPGSSAAAAIVGGTIGGSLAALALAGAALYACRLPHSGAAKEAAPLLRAS